MGNGLKFLHSHSLLENELKIPKHIVLVDEEFKDRFADIECKKFRHAGVDYIKVPTYIFANRGGTFKALMK